MTEVLSPTGGAVRRSSQLLTKLCVVGKHSEATKAMLRELEERRGITIFTSATGDEYLDQPDVVYFSEDFESAAFRRLHELAEETADENGPLLVGPQIIKRKLARDEDLCVPRPKRPIYCDIFSNVVMVMGADTKPIKRKLVDIVHFMGGQCRREVRNSTKEGLFITNDVRTGAYRTAANIGYKLLRTEYLLYCWENRNVIDFDPMDPKRLEEYKVPVFSKLTIAFLGFGAKEVDDMTKMVIENGGNVVQGSADATHLVCSHDKSEWQPISLYMHQKAVQPKWLWDSMYVGRNLHEDDFLVDLKKERRSFASPLRCNNRRSGSRSSLLDMDRSGHSILTGTPEHIYSSDDLENGTSPGPAASAPVDKRKMVCEELIGTESNYLNALQLVLKFRERIEAEIRENGPEGLLTKEEIAMIFGRLPAIYECHQRILEEMRALLNRWRPASNVGTVWINAKEELCRVYQIYMSWYDRSKELLDRADKRSVKFHAFLKSQESNPEFNRQTLRDLLMRPVQRLPSVILLLSEIKKRSENSKDKSGDTLDKAITAIKEALKAVDNNRAVTDDLMGQMHRFMDVDGVPDYLISCRRTFMLSTDVYVVGGTNKLRDMEKKRIRLQLFNDVIIVCKIRSSASTMDDYPGGTGSTSHGGTLRRMTSMVLMKSPPKPYRYLMHIPINYIRAINAVVAEDFGYPRQVPQNPPMYAVTIRENVSDDMWILYPIGDNGDQMRELSEQLCQNIYMESARDILAGPAVPVSDLLVYEELRDAVPRFIKKNQTGCNVSVNSSTMSYRQPSGTTFGFRRAVSTAGLAFSNRFQKITGSRANLRNIRESTPSLSPSYTETSSESAILHTPKRHGSGRFNPFSTLRRHLSTRHHSVEQQQYPDADKENSKPKESEV